MTGAAGRLDPLRGESPLRTPRAAAAAGIIFAVLLSIALVLLKLSIPAHPGSAGEWLTAPGRRKTVSAGLNLVPFAGIAFLWFVGVVRDRFGEREDRFFATVFLGSGLLFVAMLFAAAAGAGGLLAAAAAHKPGAPGASTLALGRAATTTLLNVYAMRMAAVFTLSAVAIGRKTGVIAGWLRVTGLVSAVVLLIGNGISGWGILLFPAWVLALSITILATRPASS